MASKTWQSGTVIDSLWLQDVNDVVYGATSPAGTLRADLANTSIGGSLLGWLRSASGAVATTLKTLLGFQEVYLSEFLTTAQLADAVAGTQTLDLAVPLQAWADACVGKVGVLPRGQFKTTVPITLSVGTIIRGAGVLSIIAAWGCNAFEISGPYVTIKDMQISSYSALGVANPRLYDGVKILGTNGGQFQGVLLENFLMPGWANAIYAKYTIDSNFNKIKTTSCDYGITFFGQCVNVHVTEGHLVCDSGQSSIRTVLDGVIQGEGLFVSNTFMASGAHAFSSEGFLSVSFDASCMADLITGKAFYITGYIQAFKSDTSWVYSADSNYYFADLGAPNETNAFITCAMGQVTGAAVNQIYWGTNNKTLTLEGNFSKVDTSTGRVILLNGSQAKIDADIKFSSTLAIEAIYINSSGNSIKTRGDTSLLYNVSPVATVASTAAVTLPRTDSHTFFISGTTNITSIVATGWDDHTITLIFQDVLTFTDGSNLKLAGNFVTSADDTITIKCAAGNWYEMSRSAN